MSDWRSYDEVADLYDPVWGPRFEVVARRIWTLAPLNAGDKILDIGVGTGIVVRTVADLGLKPAVCVGCDRSAGMVRRARNEAAALLVVVGDATALPFQPQSFDCATASFVLSHIRDYSTALAEAYRVLKPAGLLALSSWAPASDPYSATWMECLAQVISKPQAERALAEVVPWEAHFSQSGALEAAVMDAGFSVVHSDAIEVESEFTVEQFLKDRELSSTARLAVQLLGTDGWRRFQDSTARVLHARFTSPLVYRRNALIVIAAIS